MALQHVVEVWDMEKGSVSSSFHGKHWLLGPVSSSFHGKHWLLGFMDATSGVIYLVYSFLVKNPVSPTRTNAVPMCIVVFI